MKKQRYSPQRESILTIIKENGGHLNVEELYQKVRKAMPRISLGTIYRNLRTLEEMKCVSQMQDANQISYFEPFQEPHHHFICRECHSIRDLEAPNVKVCTGCISENSKMKIEKVVTTLYGICDRCQTC